MHLSRRSFLALSALLPASLARTLNASQRGGATFKVNGRGLGKRLTIVAYGDIRFTNPSEKDATDPKVRRWLVERIAEEKPNALLVSGDVPFRGGIWDDYEVYRAETVGWRKSHLKVFPALGNHELRKGDEQRCLENWWKAFPALRGCRWYSAQAGPKVYILSLDSNSALTPGSEQAQWIDSQVSHLPATVRFVFINLHHPPVADYQLHGDASHNPRPNEIALANYLKTIEPHLRARIIVSAGHVHNYERFSQDGIEYLVSGGGGAKPVTVERSSQDLYQDPAFPNYHYVKFVLNGERLEATMYRVGDPEAAAVSWEAKDRFTVEGK
jgi:acid phosphatase type 7